MKLTNKILLTVTPFLPAILEALQRFLISITSLDTFTFKDVIAWFKDRESFLKADKDNIAFTLLSGRKDNNYDIIIGIFNKKTSQIIDAEKVTTKVLDVRLAEAHQNHDLVVYE